MIGPARAAVDWEMDLQAFDLDQVPAAWNACVMSGRPIGHGRGSSTAAPSAEGPSSACCAASRRISSSVAASPVSTRQSMPASHPPPGTSCVPQHRAWWSGAARGTSRRSGSRSRQMSRRYWHRGWNRQPLVGEDRSGGKPSIGTRRSRRWPSTRGIEREQPPRVRHLGVSEEIEPWWLSRRSGPRT